MAAFLLNNRKKDNRITMSKADIKENNSDMELENQELVDGDEQNQDTATENNECECGDECDNMSDAIDILNEKIEQLTKEKLLLMADFENYRKRTLKEKADLIKSGGEDCLKRLLPIVDDVERSLGAIETSTDIEALKEGVTLISNKFNNFLSQNGIQAIDTTDADFNTEYHEAVTTFPAPDESKKGKVIDCVQKGYMMNDKVIRFAKVVVGE